MALRTKVSFQFDDSPVFDPPKLGGITKREFTAFIKRALRTGQKIAKDLTPQGATGNLKGRIVANFTASGPVDFRGEIVWDTPYGRTVARGGGPRRVALSKLKPWVAAVLGEDEDVAKTIQKSIERIGTPSPRSPLRGLNMDDRTTEQWEPEVQKIFAIMAEKVARRIEGRR